MISFGDILFQAAADCADRPARVLDEILTERVRAWADNLPADEARPEPANEGASGLNKMIQPKGFPNNLSQERKS